MPPLQLLAPAKLNLGLRILSRRDDGYHEIETVFVPLRLYDRIEIASGSRPGVQLEVSGAELTTGPDNLAVRAALTTCEALGVACELSIRLEKHIPIAAGLGGGSSDAAMVILGLERLYERPLEEAQRRALALRLGADVPFFLDPAPAVGRGIGERLEPLAEWPEMHWVLVRFAFAVETAWAYKQATRELTLPRDGSSIAALLGPAGVAKSPPNDLEIAAARRHPEIRQARRALESAGAMITGMSGSGPTLYGRFSSWADARRAARGLELPPGAGALVTSSPSSHPASWEWGVAKW